MKQMKLYKVHGNFVVTKVLVFCYYGSMNQLTGYLVAFLADLGLNPEQAGVIAGLKCFIKVFGGIMLAWLVDYMKRPKHVILLAILAITIFVTSLPFTGYYFNAKNVSFHHHQKESTTSGLNNGSDNNASANYASEKNIEEGNTKKLNDILMFWVMLILSSSYGFFDGVHPLLDTAVMNVVKVKGEGKTNFAFQRMWGSIGYALVPLLTGICIELCHHCLFSQYMPVFYIFFSLQIIFLLALTQLYIPKDEDRFDSKSPLIKKVRNIIIFKQLLKTVTQMDVWVILFNSLFQGMVFMAQWGFNILLMEREMTNFSQTTSGLAFFSTSLAEAFIAPFVGQITKSIGSPFYAMALGLSGYSITFIFYYVTRNSVYVIFINIITGLAFPLYICILPEELYRLSKRDCRTLMFGLDKGVYTGLGFGIGGVVAGNLFKRYGGKNMFLLFAIGSMLVAIATALYGFFKKRKMKEITRKQEIEISIEAF